MTAIAPATRATVEEIAQDLRATRRRRVVRGKVTRWVLRLLLLVALVGAWQLVADEQWVNPLFISRPSDIALAFWDGLAKSTLLSPLWTSLLETVAGFVIAAAAGVLAGLVLSVVPVLQDTVWPFVVAANSLPRLALVPLFVVWFGIGSPARVVLIVTVVFFIVLVNTIAGLRGCSRDHLVLARTLGAGPVRTLRVFMLPSAAPTIFAGLQLGLTYSFLGAVVAEMISGGTGLGAQLATFSSNYNTAGMFADLLLMGIVAALLSGLMTLLERWVLAWRQFEYRGLDENS